MVTGSAGGARADIVIAAVGPLSVTPMTGQYAMFGEAISRGAEMAVRDVERQGRRPRREARRLRLADDACDPALAVKVAEELAAQGVVFVDGHFCSGASIAASQVYHDRGVLMISPASINSRLTEQGFANVFRVCGRDDVQGVFAADYVVDRGLASRIAILQDQSAFGKGMADQFQKQLETRGLEPVMYEAISQGQKDFGPLLAVIEDRQIDLVYFGGYHTEAGLFVRQMRELGLGATMMVNSAMVNLEYWDLAGAGADGTLMTFSPDPRKLRSAADVVRRFEAEGYSPEGYALFAYAAIEVFAEAAEEAGSMDLDALIRTLRRRTYDSVLGPITFDSKGDVVGFRYRMYRWHDGRYDEICCANP